MLFVFLFWFLFHGVARIFQSFAFGKPAEYLLVDFSDFLSGTLLSILIIPLIKNTVLKFRWWKTIYILLISVLTALTWQVFHAFVYNSVFPTNSSPIIDSYLFKNLPRYFYLFIICNVLLGYWLSNEMRNREKLELAKLKDVQNKTQLSLLKQQLSPHFLFNALNSLYARAIKENANETQQSILLLSNLLRYSTGLDTQLTQLAKELEFSENYLKLEQSRFGQKLNIERSIKLSDNCKNYLIPTMTIQPLLENCIQHVVQKSNQSVTLQLSVKATEEIDNLTGKIIVQIKNNLPSDLPKQSDIRESNHLGSGLSNLEERLQLLYQGKAELTTKKTKSSFEVTVKLPVELSNPRQMTG